MPDSFLFISKCFFPFSHSQAYPGRDITNIVESSHYQKIGGWCRQGALNAAKCKGAQRWIKPFRCLGKYQSLHKSVAVLFIVSRLRLRLDASIDGWLAGSALLVPCSVSNSISISLCIVLQSFRFTRNDESAICIKSNVRGLKSKFILCCCDPPARPLKIANIDSIYIMCHWPVAKSKWTGSMSPLSSMKWDSG